MNLKNLTKEVLKKFKPPPKLKISEWADNYRKLSSEASAEPGQWRTDRFPLQREILDAILFHQDVVVMSSAQVGKTEVILNILGYHIAYEPCPILTLQPTLEMAETFSKDRLAPMIRDTEAITEMFTNPKSRDGSNTLLHKQFSGGHITLAGANSPASLASRPVRLILCDEVDRYPISAGTEGDPVSLAFKRTTTFWNRRRIMVSTPTIKGASRIEMAYNNSDQRRYYIPCPHCNHYQFLRWENVKWEVDESNKPLTNTSAYMCEGCGCLMSNADKLKVLSKGEWRKHNDESKIAGFHLNELYSVWRSFEDVVIDYLTAKDDPSMLKTWVNTSLGEPFEEVQGDKLNTQAIQARAENYNEMTVPEGAYIVTAGVDVQDNRLSVLIEAWGQKEESWIVYWGELMGDPAYSEVWEKLDHLLSNGVEHVRGIKLPISAVAIDSGGHHTQTVYNFCRNNKYKYHIFPIKGSSTPNRPIFSRPSKVDLNYKGKTVKNGVELFIVGTDTAKSYIYSVLSKSKHDEHGRYTHFYNALPEDFYEQLTSERRIIKYVNGFPKPYWHKDQHQRNEALDCKVYSLVASHYVGVPRLNWDKIRFQFEERLKNELKKEVKPVENKEEIQEQREVQRITPPRVRRRGDNWATSW